MPAKAGSLAAATWRSRDITTKQGRKQKQGLQVEYCSRRDACSVVWIIAVARKKASSKGASNDKT